MELSVFSCPVCLQGAYCSPECYREMIPHHHCWKPQPDIRAITAKFYLTMGVFAGVNGVATCRVLDDRVHICLRAPPKWTKCLNDVFVAVYFGPDSQVPICWMYSREDIETCREKFPKTAGLVRPGRCYNCSDDKVREHAACEGGCRPAMPVWQEP